MAATKVILLACFLPWFSIAQAQDSSTVNKKRLRTIVIAGTSGYTASMVGLNTLWYSNSERQSFQFFDDRNEWYQVDKLGHFYGAYYFSYGTHRALQWSGIDSKKSAWVSSVTGFLIMLPIEIMDGYSADYGASGSDLLANAVGSTFFLSQELLWHEQRILPKFSFHRTDFAPQRPNVLGSDLTSEILKDYNGQTHWLSFDMDKFVRFPAWLNLAVGYGAEGMIYAPAHLNADSYRQFYFSIDPDLTAIKTRSKFVRSALFILNMIKLPSPTLAFSKKGTRAYAFYF